MTKFKISKNIHFFKKILGVLKEIFSNNISIEKIKKMGVFRLMARLGLSELAFVWSFYTVAQSIAFILLLSNKNVITGYIMTITRRKNSQTIFWEQRHIQGVGGGQAGGGWHASTIKVVAHTKCRRQQSEALIVATSQGGGSEKAGQDMRGISCGSLTTVEIFLSKLALHLLKHVKLLLRNTCIFLQITSLELHKNESSLFWT